MFLILLVPTIWMRLDAVEFDQSMGPGEILQFEDYIISENKQFRMGFNSGNGRLEITDISDNGLSSVGSVFWCPKYINTHYGITYKDAISGKKKYHFKFAWDAFHGEPLGGWDHGVPYGVIGSKRSLVICNGALSLRDSDGIVMWNTEQEINTGLAKYTDKVQPGKQMALPEEVYLVLENCGRAKLISEGGIIVWCSCPYCMTCHRLWRSDGFIYIDHYTSEEHVKNGLFHRAKMMSGGMLTHAESKEYFDSSAAVGSSASSRNAHVLSVKLANDEKLFFEARERCNSKKHK